MENSKYSENSERAKLEKKYMPLLREDFSYAQKVSYIGNKQVPFLRLFRYKEAFSYDFVASMLQRFSLDSDDLVFDPFTGMGTTNYTSMVQSIPSIGIDRLPFAVFLSNTLPKFHLIRVGELRDKFEIIRQVKQGIVPADIADDINIIQKGFDPEVLLELRKWRASIEHLETPYYDVMMMLFLSILEKCSYTAKDGQYLRFRRNRKIPNPDEAFQAQVNRAEEDLIKYHKLMGKKQTSSKYIPTILQGDTRDLSDIHFEKPPTMIITSPPYANRYDYSRIYSVELAFKFVDNFEELKDIRFGLLRSHIESKVDKKEKSKHPAVKEIISELEHKELNNKKIPDLINGYFIDMKRSINEWGRYMSPESRIALVVNNVRFAGEVIPVDLILSDFAEQNDYETKEIIISKYKGNSSQQMKKYGRIPVRDSILIWERS